MLSTSLHHLMDDVEQQERAAAIRQAETSKMVQEVPAPANISITTCQIQNGWSLCSERLFER